MTRALPLALSFLLLAGVASPAPAATTRFATATPTTLILEGSSNVAAWRCQSASVEAQMTVTASLEKINLVIDHIEDGNIGAWMAQPDEGRFPVPQFALVIPIAALRCGNAVMERDMRHALMADRFPSIEFRFKDLHGSIQHDIDRNDYTATIAGELSMAGTRREIELSVVAQRIGRDRIRLQAELPLRMSDFGVKPPTALFGIVKARDKLVVRFDLTLQVAS